jgi:tight adherence protein B
VVSATALLAGLAGACAVGAAWEAVAGAAPVRGWRRVREVLRPLQAAGRTGREPSVAERRRLAALAGLALLAGGWLVAGPVAGAAVALGGPWTVAMVVRARRRRWQRALAAAAPGVARGMADALGGGHSVRGALLEVAHVHASGAAPGALLTGPAAGELRAACDALALGEPTDQVLERLQRRARSPAWNAMVAAILLQREAGGDLAGLLRALAADLEAARRAEGEARTATAQARFTAWLVAALPLGAILLGELAAPGSAAAIVGHPVAAVLVVAALVLEVLAFVAVARLSRLDAVEL